jgi:hypothetical protein
VKLNHETNLKYKISWHCPFNFGDLDVRLPNDYFILEVSLARHPAWLQKPFVVWNEPPSLPNLLKTAELYLKYF